MRGAINALLLRLWRAEEGEDIALEQGLILGVQRREGLWVGPWVHPEDLHEVLGREGSASRRDSACSPRTNAARLPNSCRT